MQEKLLILRKRNKLTQKQTARRLGLSEYQYRQKELGNYEFTADEMFNASYLFNAKIEEIFLPRSHQNGDKTKI